VRQRGRPIGGQGKFTGFGIARTDAVEGRRRRHGWPVPAPWRPPLELNRPAPSMPSASVTCRAVKMRWRARTGHAPTIVKDSPVLTPNRWTLRTTRASGSGCLQLPGFMVFAWPERNDQVSRARTHQRTTIDPLQDSDAHVVHRQSATPAKDTPLEVEEHDRCAHRFNTPTSTHVVPVQDIAVHATGGRRGVIG